MKPNISFSFMRRFLLPSILFLLCYYASFAQTVQITSNTSPYMVASGLGTTSPFINGAGIQTNYIKTFDPSAPDPHYTVTLEAVQGSGGTDDKNFIVTAPSLPEPPGYTTDSLHFTFYYANREHISVGVPVNALPYTIDLPIVSENIDNIVYGRSFTNKMGEDKAGWNQFANSYNGTGICIRGVFTSLTQSSQNQTVGFFVPLLSRDELIAMISKSNYTPPSQQTYLRDDVTYYNTNPTVAQVYDIEGYRVVESATPFSHMFVQTGGRNTLYYFPGGVTRVEIQDGNNVLLPHPVYILFNRPCTKPTALNHIVCNNTTRFVLNDPSNHDAYYDLQDPLNPPMAPFTVNPIQVNYDAITNEYFASMFTIPTTGPQFAGVYKFRYKSTPLATEAECIDTTEVLYLGSYANLGTGDAQTTVCYGGDPLPLGTADLQVPTNLTDANLALAGITRTFQWYKKTIGVDADSVLISGATDKVYDPPAGITAQTYYYRNEIYTFHGQTCEKASTAFAIVNVQPQVTMTQPENVAYCANVATTVISFTGGVAGTIYNWTNDNTSIGLAASGSGDIPSFTALNTSTTVANVATITVIPQYTYNAGAVDEMICDGAPYTFTITVNPLPTMSDPSNIIVCHNETVPSITFSGAPAGTTYTWTRDRPDLFTELPTSGSGNILSFTAVSTSNTVSQTTTITVTPTLNGCPGTPQTFTIVVRANVEMADPADQVLCSGTPTTAVTFTSAATAVTYQWTAVSTPNGLYNGSGTGATLASFTPINTTGTNEAITYTVTPYRQANGAGQACAGTQQTFTITVQPQPIVAPSASPNPICAGNQVVIRANHSGGTPRVGSPAGPYDFDWSPNLGSSHTIVDNPTATTSYTVTITDANSCTSSGTVEVTVLPKPEITATASPNIICSSGSSVLSYTPSYAGASQQWYTTNTDRTVFTPIAGASNATVEVQPNSTTDYAVILETTNGCKDTAYTKVFVFELTAGSIGSDQVLCGLGTAPALITSVAPATSTSGPTSFTYQWQKSTDMNCLTGFTDIPGANSPTYQPPVLTQSTVYRRKIKAVWNPVIVCEQYSNCVKIMDVKPQVPADDEICFGGSGTYNLPDGSRVGTVHGIYLVDWSIASQPSNTASLVGDGVEGNVVGMTVPGDYIFRLTNQTYNCYDEVKITVLPSIATPAIEDESSCSFGLISKTCGTASGTTMKIYEDAALTIDRTADFSLNLLENQLNYWHYTGSPFTGTKTFYAACNTTANGCNSIAEPFTSAYDACALPVQLVSFKGRAEHCKVNLEWLTALEENFDYFEVERKIGNGSYEVVAKVQAKGSFSTYAYSEGLYEKQVSYRLKMVDKDGQYEYSRAVNFIDACANRPTGTVVIYPNPVDHGKQVNIEYTSDVAMPNAQIIVYDMYGKLVDTRTIDIKTGTNVFESLFMNMSSGTYMVSIMHGKQSLTKPTKVIVLN